jgi:hypothetical protein
VPIRFETGTLPEGLYVPVRAILDLNGKRSVYVVNPDDTVTQVAVLALDDTIGDLRRIEAVGAALPDGTRIAVEGVQYLSEGVAVDVKGAVAPGAAPSRAGSVK